MVATIADRRAMLDYIVRNPEDRVVQHAYADLLDEASEAEEAKKWRICAQTGNPVADLLASGYVHLLVEDGFVVTGSGVTGANGRSTSNTVLWRGEEMAGVSKVELWSDGSKTVKVFRENRAELAGE